MKSIKMQSPIATTTTTTTTMAREVFWARLRRLEAMGMARVQGPGEMLYVNGVLKTLRAFEYSATHAGCLYEQAALHIYNGVASCEMEQDAEKAAEAVFEFIVSGDEAAYRAAMAGTGCWDGVSVLQR